MNIQLDSIGYDDQGNKIVYLHFLDDDGKIVDASCVLYTDDETQFCADVAGKFQAQMKLIFDKRDAATRILSHLDALDISNATYDPDTKEIKLSQKALGVLKAGG
jgi:hypothetical protein